MYKNNVKCRRNVGIIKSSISVIVCLYSLINMYIKASTILIQGCIKDWHTSNFHKQMFIFLHICHLNAWQIS